MKRARYVGPSDTEIDLTVTLADGQIRELHVPQGDLTPEELAGQPIPDEVIDGLLEQPDNWQPEKPAAAKKTAAKGGEEE